MRGEINFFKEKISFTLRNKGVLRQWIFSTIEQEGKVAGDINFILCDDDFLAELNFKYLRHKSLTDILTFSIDDENGHLCGDIYISLPRVRENALEFKQKAANELHRVMIHGILHLIGYNDSTKSEKLLMRSKEDHYLGILFSKL